MNMQPCTCRWKKQHSYSGIGKTHITFCGKKAVAFSPNGGDDRPLCQEHINRVLLKNKIAKLKAETGFNKTTLKLKGLI